MAEVFCPTCKKKIQFSPENIFRPFCSERCQLIDLGQWAEGNYKFPCQEDDAENIFPEGDISEDDQN